MTRPEKGLHVQPDAELVERWQKVVDIMAKLVGVPAGLIMRIVEEDIEVFLSSRTEGNPYKPGDKEHLHGSGLYCETVINSKRPLLIPNALKDPEWSSNPDIKLDMISYFGMPILYPDGRPFGTICILDQKENAYSDTFIELVQRFREIVEGNLHLLYANQLLGEKNKTLSDYIDEIQVLRGILPICSFCKKVRDDKGYWEAVDSYISRHSETRFSHSICPKCMEKEYPEFVSQDTSAPDSEK